MKAVIRLSGTCFLTFSNSMAAVVFVCGEVELTKLLEALSLCYKQHDQCHSVSLLSVNF